MQREKEKKRKAEEKRKRRLERKRGDTNVASGGQEDIVQDPVDAGEQNEIPNEPAG